MQSSLGISRNAAAIIGVAAVIAVVGWYKAFDYGAELRRTQEAAAATEASLQARAGELESRLKTVETELADTKKTSGELAAVRERLAQATSGLNQRLATLGDREKEVAAVEGRLREKQAALDALETRLEQARSQLNARLGVMAERERESVGLDRDLARLRTQKKAGEAELAELQSRIGQRLQVLGEREHTLGDVQAQLRAEQHRLQQLMERSAKLTKEMDAMRAELGSADVLLAKRRAEAEENVKRVLKAKQTLEDLRQLVSQ